MSDPTPSARAARANASRRAHNARLVALQQGAETLQLAAARDEQEQRIAEAVATILHIVEPEAASREGLRDTPMRVARMYRELLTPKPFSFTTFDAEGADQMIVVRDIPFYTLCEHHLIPFFGHATLAYIPSDRIAGLSKLARAVEFFARRLQTQERLTNQVADFLVEKLDPRGVGVVVVAHHLCMEMRGVQKPGVATLTSALRGALLDEPSARAEFLSLAHATSAAQQK